MLRVLVIDELEGRAARICDGLLRAGHQVAAVLSSSLDLAAQVERIKPDIILIETESPSRDTLEHLSIIDRENPRPVVIFSQDDNSQAIREAMKAGVSAYVVDGLDPARVKPVVDVAVARFESYLAMRRELEETSRKLSERKAVDRAKGILMQQRGMSEEEAYKALRKLAMDRKQTLGAVANDVIEMARLLI